MSDDPYTDDKYDSSYRETHGDEPPKDQHVDETTDGSFFPSGGSLLRSGRGLWSGNDAADADYDGTANQRDATEKGAPSARMEDAESDDDDGWLGEGVITLALVAGLVLFLFPEPATSAVGIALVGLGVVAWVADRLV